MQTIEYRIVAHKEWSIFSKQPLLLVWLRIRLAFFLLRKDIVARGNVPAMMGPTISNLWLLNISLIEAILVLVMKYLIDLCEPSMHFLETK